MSVSAPLFGRSSFHIDGNLGKMVRLGCNHRPDRSRLRERRSGVRFVIDTLPPIEITAGDGFLAAEVSLSTP